MVPILPSPLRSQPSYAANHSSSRTFSTGAFKTTRDLYCSRGSSQQQVTEQQQQLQQHSQQEQQLLSAQSTNLAPLQAGMAAPYAPGSGPVKLSVEMPAAAAGLACLPNQGSAAAGVPGHGSSRQGSINSSFFDADSVFEAGCNSRESFLLPEDVDEAPFNSSAAPVIRSSAPAAATGSSRGTTSSNWLSGIATPFGARSPLVCSAGTVAAMLADDAAPSMDLLQLDGDLAAPGNNPFSCLNNEDAAEQLLSFYEPAAPPPAAPDFAGLFDAPAADSGSNAAADPAEASAGAAALATQHHRGMVGLSASMAASAALRRGQQDDSSSNSMASSSEQANVTHSLQQQQQQGYTLVLLDGSTGAPLTAAAGARDAEQLSMMIGNSPTTATTAMHDALGHGAFGQGHEYSGFGVVGKKAAAGAAAAVLDNTFSAAGAGGDLPRGGGSVRGRPGRPKGNVGRPSKATAAAKAAAAATFSAAASFSMQPSMEIQGMASVSSAALAATMLGMAPVMTSSSSRRSSEAGDSLVQTDPAAAAAMTRSDSGSGGDSSNESATTQQQEDASKCPASHLTIAVAAPAAVSSASKHNQRVFHHKGGGPCDHCGVLESPQWRRGPPAKPILCNACGTRYRRTHNLGPPIPSSGRPGGRQGIGSGSSSGVIHCQSPTAVGHRQHGNSSTVGSGFGGRKRSAPAALLQTPVLVNMNGGVHTGTRSGGSPAVGRRPVLKIARS